MVSPNIYFNLQKKSNACLILKQAFDSILLAITNQDDFSSDNL